MRWPWRRRETPVPEPPSGDSTEATDALRAAVAELRQEEKRTAEVKEVADELRRHQEVNHFAELFLRALERGPR